MSSVAVLVVAGCRPAEQPDATPAVVLVDGFTGPEAVRYDPDQDVYFVSNFGRGDLGARDNNGFIARMSPDGQVEQMRFIAGGANGVTLHSPRGMTIVGDTLWVADADAVRGFDRRTGAPVASVDFSALDVGFLNDVSPDAEGAVYVTDTGKDRVYRVRGGPIAAITDSSLGGPNGITWDAANRRFIVVPYFRGNTLRGWIPGGDSLIDVGTSAGGKFDGVEILEDGRILVASQKDSSLHLFANGSGTPIIRVGGEPADIAVDTRRNRVAVPMISRNLVGIWAITDSAR
jgi:sugar lactone lactonase YvrE